MERALWVRGWVPHWACPAKEWHLWVAEGGRERGRYVLANY